MKAPAVPVKAGQVWADNDKRAQGRTLRVLEVTGSRATCEVLTLAGGKGAGSGRKVVIQTWRMRPVSTGYRLVQDA